MYRVAVLGERDSIYGFAAIGLDTWLVDNAAEVQAFKGADRRKICGHLHHGKPSAMLESEIDRYSAMQVPAIILIPGIGQYRNGYEKCKEIRGACGRARYYI